MPRTVEQIPWTLWTEGFEVPEDQIEKFISAIYGKPYKEAEKDILLEALAMNKKEDNAPSTKQNVIFTKPKKYKKASLR